MCNPIRAVAHDLHRELALVLVEAETIPDRFIPRITTEQASDRLRTIHEEILARPLADPAIGF